MIVAKYAWQWIAVLFNNFSRKSLGNLNGLGNAAALSY
jgi:hypothetical protein